jgi:hypothetical protein
MTSVETTVAAESNNALASMGVDEMQVESLDAQGESEGDLYTRLKVLQRQLEFYEIQVRALIHRVSAFSLLCFNRKSCWG